MTPGLNDAVITSVFHKLAMHAVTFWAEYIRVPFSRVFYINGIRVKISIEEHKTDQDTKPLRAARDEDDNRVD